LRPMIVNSRVIIISELLLALRVPHKDKRTHRRTYSATSASQDLALASPLVSMAGLPKRKLEAFPRHFPERSPLFTMPRATRTALLVLSRKTIVRRPHGHRQLFPLRGWSWRLPLLLHNAMLCLRSDVRAALRN